MPEPVSKAESTTESSVETTAGLGLDELLYETAHRNEKKPIKVLADEIGIPLKRLYAATDPLNKQPFALRLLVPLMRATADFSVLRWLAHTCGFLLIEAPEITTPADVMASIGHIAHETGDVLKTLGVVLADGSVCAADARIARKEIAELLERAHALDQSLARIEAGR